VSLAGTHSIQGSASGRSDGDRATRCEILSRWLYEKQIERMWSTKGPGEGVFVKISKGNYTCVPLELVEDGSRLFEAILQMNIRVSEPVELKVLTQS
jgi:hypothetical protein